MEIVRDFVSLGSKITVDGDYSHEMKTLVLWNDSYDKPRQHTKKQRHYFADKGLCSQSYGFSCSHTWMWELDHKEDWEFSNCGVGEDYWESPGLQGDQTCPSWRKLILNIPWKDGCWRWSSNTSATWWEGRADSLEKSLMLGKIEGRRRRGRGWDSWMASLTQWTWVWANSGRWWRTGKPGVLQSVGLQRVGHNWVTEKQE